MSANKNMNRIKIHFKNGWSVSVIHGDGSYGLEAAVLNPDNDIVGDVHGWISGEDLIELLTEIKNK